MASAHTSSREQVGWYFYDWANSAFSTTVVTLLLGPHLTELAKAAANGEGFVYPLGLKVYAGSYWGYLLSLSVASQVLLLPVAGAIADCSRRKKLLLALFAYLGAAATAAMFFLTPGRYLLGGLLFLVSNLSFGASMVVYNSFLPDIATAEERDAVSSKGWGIGYLGGGILLALNLLLAEFADRLGLTEAQVIRVNLCSAGVWWALFTVIPLARLRNHAPVRSGAGTGRTLTAGFLQLGRTLRDLKRYPQTLTFVLAFLFYNDAIQAVIALSGQFAFDALKMPIATLALAILMVQFVAFFGAIVFNSIARLLGAKGAVMLALVIWTVVLVAIYGWVKTTAQYFVAAAAVGLVLGGSQALSRSLFSLMIPKGKEAEYFSLYEISDKGTSWLAPLIFALTVQFTKSYRLGILSLVVSFIAGLAVLARVNVRRAAQAAGNEAP